MPDDQTRDDEFKKRSENHFFAFLETMQTAFNKFVYDRLREYTSEQENKLCKCPHCGIDIVNNNADEAMFRKTKEAPEEVKE